MDRKPLLLISLSVFLVYLILDVYLRGDGALQPLTAMSSSYSRSLNSTSMATDAVNGDVQVDGLRLSSILSIINSSATDKPPCLRKVQFWNYPYQGDSLEGRSYCPGTDCTIEYTHSSSYDDMRSSDVIVLHHIGSWDIKKINRVRRTDQIIAYMTWEIPSHSQRMSDLGSFNWSMTYNFKSQIPIPYGWYERNSPTDERDITRLPTKNWALGKTGLAIWIVSNCRPESWPRMDYGRKLAKYMKIDIFGACGKPCGDQESCYKRMYSYKFYIAFENSMCEDYITEKFWINALQHDAVPIVYGAPKRDYERQAPKDSFIHISDFSTMSSLAAYIDTVDKNDTLYNGYFEWRKGYHAISLGINGTAVNEATLCSISERIVGNSKASDVSNSSYAEWFKKSCGHVPRPSMV